MSETQNPNASRGTRGIELSVLVERARARTRALLTQGLGQSMGTDPNPTSDAVEIRFDLRGKTAGQVRMGPNGRTLIRYNLALLEREGVAFLERTVPHEVAHVLAYRRYGPRIRPHGQEWQRIMRQLGAEPTRCHDYDVSGLPTRRLRYFAYHCACMEHRLSSIRHNKVAKGQRYLCKRCGEALRPGLRRVAG